MYLLQIIIIMISILILTSCNDSGIEEVKLSPAEVQTDRRLNGLIRESGLVAVNNSAQFNNLTELGKKLFNDKNLSGNRDISCSSCHDPNFGTSDSLALSIGTGATGEGPNRVQINSNSKTIRRHSPQLFNLGQDEQEMAFYDGRVQMRNDILTTPVPISANISTLLTSALDAQTIFPLLSNDEMLGQLNSNDLATSSDNHTIWDNIMSRRVLIDTDYLTLLQSAYPTTQTYNIGHIGRALGEFIKNEFLVSNTPYDKYILGDTSALNLSQKRGLEVFLTRGQCIQCHSGPNLTDNQLHSVGVPHIYPSLSSNSDDTGREEVTGLSSDRYRFKTPGLRNISKTSPFMHNGSIETLEDVVNHYNNIGNSLSNYQISPDLQASYQEEILVDKNFARQTNRFNAIDNRRLRSGLNLSSQERTDLVNFMKSLSN